MELDDNGQPVELPALSPERLVAWEGQTFIANDSLTLWYPHPKVGDIVRINGHVAGTSIYVELEARFIYSQGDKHIVAWWVHRIDPEGWVPDAIPEA